MTIRRTAFFVMVAAMLCASDLSTHTPTTARATGEFSASPLGPESFARAVARSSAGALIAQTLDEHRACPGCPPRRIGHAFIQTTIINVFYELGNLARGEETAKLTPKTWWTNMKRGWEWDSNDFTVNQI